MTQTNPVMDFLLTRRSPPAGALTLPAPEGAALDQLLTAALRVPDHGGLEPWRLLVIEAGARPRLAALLRERGPVLGIPPEKIEKSAQSWLKAPLIVAVVASPVESQKAPLAEQLHSAGAVCLSLVNAALASGWGAAWITGWAAFDAGFTGPGLGLAPHESIAGFVHLGSVANATPDRPRPDLSRRVGRVSA